MSSTAATSRCSFTLCTPRQSTATGLCKETKEDAGEQEELDGKTTE